MNYTATVSTKGQVVIPLPVRKALGLKAADKISFRKSGDRFVVDKTPSVDDFIGVFHNPNIKPLSIKAMNKVIDEGLFSDDYENVPRR